MPAQACGTSACNTEIGLAKLVSAAPQPVFARPISVLLVLFLIKESELSLPWLDKLSIKGPHGRLYNNMFDKFN